jgi:hypothetical protein
VSTKCFTPLLGKRIRVTTLSECGQVPAAATPDAVLATDGFVTVSLSSEIEDGTEIVTKKADGSLCVNEKFASSFKRFMVDIEFCQVNPSLLSMITNAEPYEDGAGEVIGFTVGEGYIDKKFAFELWTGMAGAECGSAGQSAGGYLLLPYLNAGTLGDVEINGESEVTFSMTGAYTIGGNNWGVGPYNVVEGVGVNEVQRVSITGTPTGGSFTLTFNGQTTASIAYNAAAAAVQSALEALSNVDPGDIVASGGPLPGAFVTLTFGGKYAGQDVAQLTATGSFTGGTTPAVAVTTTTPGVTAGAPLPTPLDVLDHLLMIATDLAPPPSACDPIPMPAAV